VKRHADMGGAVCTKPERTDGKAARSRGGFPSGRIAAVAAIARGSAHDGYGVA